MMASAVPMVYESCRRFDLWCFTSLWILACRSVARLLYWTSNKATEKIILIYMVMLSLATISSWWDKRAIQNSTDCLRKSDLSWPPLTKPTATNTAQNKVENWKGQKLENYKEKKFRQKKTWELFWTVTLIRCLLSFRMDASLCPRSRCTNWNYYILTYLTYLLAI